MMDERNLIDRSQRPDGRTSAHRAQWLDSLRVLGLVLVVVQHACLGAWMYAAGIGETVQALIGIASLGAPILVVASGYASALARGFGERQPAHLHRRLVRLGVPYLVWTALFFLMQNFLPFGHPVRLTAYNVLSGTGIYVVLWYLPLLMWASAFGWLPRSRRQRSVAAGIAFTVYLLQPVWARLGSSMAANVVRFFAGMAVWTLFYLIGQMLASVPRDRFRTPSAAFALASAFVLSLVVIAWTAATRYPGYAEHANTVYWLSVIVATVSALLLARNAGEWRLLPAVAGVTLGVYMMHLPLLSLLGKLVPGGVMPWWLWVPVSAAAALALSGALSSLLARTPLRGLVA